VTYNTIINKGRLDNMMNTALTTFANNNELVLGNGDFIIEVYLGTLNTESTRTLYKKSINDFFKFTYGGQPLTVDMFRISPAIAIQYMNIWRGQLENGIIKTSTYNSKIKGIKSFYNWAMGYSTNALTGEKLIHVNPFANEKMKSENDSEGSEPLSIDEINLMLGNPYGASEHIINRNLLIFELGITTGIRCDALMGIKVSDISKHSTDIIVSAKGKEDKTAKKPINHYYDRIIAWYNEDIKVRTKDNGTIFNITPIHANRIIKEWASQCDINKNITFHSLRTTTAVQIYHNTNGNLFKVQKMLDHAHVSTSKIYVDKENVVVHDGEDIMVNIKEASKIEDMLQNLTKEQLIKIISDLDVSTKINIMNKLR
jgi:site-specific recombinase XerD